MAVIRDKCAEIMEKQGITVSDIVIATGMPDSTVRNALSVNSKAPSVYTVGPICAYLRVSLDDIFGIIRPGAMKKLLNQKEIDDILGVPHPDDSPRRLNQNEIDTLMDLLVENATQAEVIKNLRAERLRVDRKVQILKWACVGLAVALAIVVLIMVLV